MTARRRRPERVFMKSAEAMSQADDFHQRIRALEALGGGTAIYAIEVFEIEFPVVAGDGAFEWEIPEDLDGAVLLKVEGYVNTPSSSGSVQVQLHLRDGTGASQGDMLTSKITIEAGDLNSKDAGTQPAVDATNDDVVWGDHIRVDVDAAGAGTLGLGIISYWTPVEVKTLAVQGAQGAPGGIVEWTGQWTNTTVYQQNVAVTNNGSSYVSIVTHTSDPSTEPGVGASWETVWMLLSQAQGQSALSVSITGNFPLTTGIKTYLYVPFACTIVAANLLSHTVGSVVVDIWKDTYGNHPPTDADSITGASPLTLAVANKTLDTALVGWTTSLAEGDVLAFHIDSVSNIQVMSVGLVVERI